MKKGPLSNDEKAWVEKYYATLTVAQIASEMDRSESIIAKHIDKLEHAAETNVEDEVAQEPTEATTEEDVASSDHTASARTSNLFARREDHGVTIMTKDASMAGDDSRESRCTNSPERYDRFIHRIRD